MRRVLICVAVLLACDGAGDGETTHATAHTGGESSTGESTTGEPETGTFALEVRPIFDAHCVGCHGPVGAQLGLVLGPRGQISSEEVLAGLVDVPATAAPMPLVTPGDPARSWLTRKLTGDFAGVTCDGTCGGAMPPAGTPLTPEELATIAAWIAAGAR